MDLDETSRVIRQLAVEWAQADLPGELLTYADYVRSIAGLQQATGDASRTQYIVAAVIKQAGELGKNSVWVAQELRFEALAQSVSHRAVLLLLDLEDANAVDDAALDLYNERVKRFGIDQ